MSLPAGVFKPYAGVKTAVLVFRRPNDEKAKKTSKIWFYEVRADGYDPDKITGGGRPETPDRNDIPDLLKQWATYKASGFKKPPGVEAGTLLEPESEDLRCWWALTNKIAENDYILPFHELANLAGMTERLAQAGLIVLRHPHPTLAGMRRLVQQVALAVGQNSPAGQLWIVEPGRIRIHLNRPEEETS